MANACCSSCSGLRLKAGLDVLLHKDVWINTQPEKKMFLPPHHFFFFLVAEVIVEKILPALVCWAGSWQKCWEPWRLFWAGLHTGATHTAASAHYTWKHPGLWSQHTHTVAAMWHCVQAVTLNCFDGSYPAKLLEARPQICPPPLLD